jgi:4-hydroxy-tetrahydrodipicolinate synthase
MPSTTFTGVLTALVTPFRGGKVSFEDIDKLVDAQIAAGISGLVPVGTTGESPTVSHAEHMDVVRAVIARSAGRVPVVAGTGSNSTQEAIDLTRAAHEAGADGVLVVAPYYNKPSQEGLFRHFSAIAETTDKPVVLYSIPGRCVIEIGVGTVERLRAKYPNVSHIKEAGGSCDRVDQLRNALGDSLTILSGDDGLTLPFISLGAKGVISVASNLVPHEVIEMTRAAMASDRATALRVHNRLYPLFKALFVEPNPVPVKHAMVARGIISSPETRLPLCPMSGSNLALVDRVLAELGS